MIWTILDVIGIIAMLCLGHFVWWGVFGVECYFNGLSLSHEGPQWTLPYHGWLQDTRWQFLPWTKTEHIRTLVGVDDADGEGYLGDFTYTEIRRRNLYAWVAWKELPGPIHYFGTHIVLPLIPLAVYLALTRFWSF